MFFDKTLYSHSASAPSPPSGVYVGNDKLPGKPEKCRGGGGCDKLASHPGESSNTTSRYSYIKYRGKLRLGGPIGSSTDCILLPLH